jgi:hypothetical protein
MNLRQLSYWILFLLLLVLHQDYWQWERNEILFDFLPYTMAYNIGISLVTALVWLFVCRFLWPHELDEFEVVAANPDNQEAGEGP